MRAALSACLLAVSMTAAPAPAQMLDFETLDGWPEDNHRAALAAFLETCDQLDAPDWQPICRLAADAGTSDASAKAFFELMFKPVLIGNPPALFTGYYEPELDGSPIRTPRFAYPIYARPPELQDGQVYHDRASIESGALRGRGLEIAWLDDPVEAFFLQIQGSGRIRMTDGRVIRVGYAGRNGHAYRSVGKEMIARGMRTPDQVSAQDIRHYVRGNPTAGNALLNTNPSYVFFRKIGDLPADKGPIGAMGRSITAMRSVAIDPSFTPLGVPVWIEKTGDTPIRSLMVAQDTGGAIKGAQRADIFYGTGAAAGDAAGTIKDGGRMILLLPIDRAYAMLPEG
ncbi:MAG: membrane-bound lytic murein transglycosylase A [Rhodobacteraceae bacterium]|uniref:murein transglycosylase A n=1 Tax=Cypionkella sp. TaxID=2811411 RepID=UPI00132434E4|nr:murein transglycosylase A [Cypionkella sp.]KAF0175764.1 MAG: membrane-bound lytic murein transglycosylase A [Paracoccaceae bacterium]MDO8326424.1 murein transglycosylase A [Cypionkella sp.]